MQSRHFSDRNTSIILVMNRAGTRKSAAGGVGSGAKRVALPGWRKFKEARDRLHLAVMGFMKSPPRDIGMGGLHT